MNVETQVKRMPISRSFAMLSLVQDAEHLLENHAVTIQTNLPTLALEGTDV
jgi:hypothetical protein